MSLTDEEKARLLARREAKSKKAEEAELDAEALELAVLDLEAKLEIELGPRGKEFEIVETPDGPIGLKRGEFVLYKKFSAALSDDTKPTTIEDAIAYVTPCVVHPSREAFLTLIDKRPGFITRCANACVTLHGSKEAKSRSKF